MKGKIKLLGHIGLMLFLVSALMLAVAPVAQAATAVTSVWVEFPYSSSKNATSSTAGEYYIHFKPATALVRGVDWVTVTFPDGSTAMGPAAFTAITGTVAAADLEFSTDYGTSVVSSATWKRSTSNATTGGYRVKVKVPFDYAAGTDVWLRITSTSITSASTAGDSYKVYVSTTKDTTPVLSSAFTLGSSVCTALTTAISPATAGAASQYTFTFTTAASTGALTADTSTVTVKFPVGTTLPSSITASNVQFSADGSSYTAAGTTPIVDTNKRTITATVSVSGIAAADTGYMRVLSGAGVTNPTTASSDDYKCMILTSSDRQYFVAASAHTVSAGSATAVTVANGEVGLSSEYYSDNATMINMYSSAIYLVLTDANGNAKAPASAVTVTLSSSSASGAFYTNSAAAGTGTMTSATTVSLDAATPDEGQTVYYKDSAAGTYTLTFSASGYTSATWTFTVVPGVSLYDASNNLVSTYAPTSTSPASETSTSYAGSAVKYASDYINDAITAAMAGDTVKLGDGTYEVDNDSYINLNKAVTLTSVNGASSTTIRNTEEIDKAILVNTDGAAATPIVISGLTFQRLRATVDIDCAVYNNGNDYVTVQNCIFNNIEPDQNSATEGVVWFSNGDTITSATISNNTFNNCVTEWPDMGSGAKSGCIIMDGTAAGGTAAISGVTISGNTLTNCYQYGITFSGNSTNRAAGSITNNTITNGYSAICVADGVATSGLSITGNTITGAYSYAVKVEGTANGPITIKNNTITGCAGTSTSYAVRIERQPASGTHYVQYNDISGNQGYAIKVDSTDTIAVTEINCMYNYYGNASGPSYTALTGATVTKSNPNGTGDTITDRVFYYPWLHKSLANVVADNASYQASTIKLVSGWNTLSTPVKLISAADAIDELITSGMTIGYYYDATGWHQITAGYVLNACDAVYVKMSAATYVLLKFDASAFSTPSKSLAAGWNLIGLAALDSDGMHADDAVASVAKTAANLPGYAQVISSSLNATQTDMYGNTGTSWAVAYGQASVTDLMYAGLGYWVYMQNAATLAGFEITPIAPDLD